MVTSGSTLLAPALARVWLATRGDNAGDNGTRTVVGVVQQPPYVDAMLAGQWRDGSVIEFWPDGRLKDGCNRCYAVIASGVSITVTVVVVDEQ